MMSPDTPTLSQESWHTVRVVWDGYVPWFRGSRLPRRKAEGAGGNDGWKDVLRACPLRASASEMIRGGARRSCVRGRLLGGLLPSPGLLDFSFALSAFSLEVIRRGT